MSFLFRPIEQWQHEISKASKSGLLAAIDELTLWRGYDRDTLMKMAKRAQRDGRYYDATRAHLEFMANPKKVGMARWKKSVAAKKAARRRKREAKKGTR